MGVGMLWAFQLHSSMGRESLPLSICPSDIPTLVADSTTVLYASCPSCSNFSTPNYLSTITPSLTLSRCEHLDYKLESPHNVSWTQWSLHIFWTRTGPSQASRWIHVHGTILKMKAENESPTTSSKQSNLSDGECSHQCSFPNTQCTTLCSHTDFGNICNHCLRRRD